MASGLVIFCPRVLFEETVDHFLHREVWNELILRQLCPCDWVKMTNSLKNTHQRQQFKLEMM